VEVRSLRYVVTLAEELHFGRAARRHYIAAQPFGQVVHRLERELGYPLFARTSRRVVATPAGQRFVAHARSVLADLDSLAELGGREPGRRPPTEVTVGVLGFGLAEQWEPLRRHVADQRPDLVIGHRDLDLSGQYDAVRTGEVDVGVVMDVGPVDGLVLDRVLSMPPVAVVPAGSPLAAADRLKPGDLSGHPLVPVAGPAAWLSAWAGYGLTRDRTGPLVRNPSAIPAAVATTGRIGLHLDAARRFYPRPDVRFVPIDAPPGDIAIATREGDDRPAVTAFRQAAQAAQAAQALAQH